MLALRGTGGTDEAGLTVYRMGSDSSDVVDGPGLAKLEIGPLPILVRCIPWTLRSQP